MTDTTNETKSISGDMKLAWQLLRDSESPFYLKLLPLAAVLYFFFPEFMIPVAGWPLATPIDDVAILYAALRGVIGLAPPHLVAKYTGDQSLNYVDGEYEVVEEGEDEKPLAEDIIIDNDIHEW